MFEIMRVSGVLIFFGRGCEFANVKGSLFYQMYAYLKMSDGLLTLKILNVILRRLEHRVHFFC